jgi:hypothetical protein
MRSVADDLRARTSAQVLALSVPDRMALAFSLGDADLEVFARASGLDRQDALRRLRTQRSRERRPSVANICP